MWYYERYANHNKAEKHATKLLPVMEQHCQRLHECKNYPPAELQFLQDAVLTAKKCSSMLKWSYAYGYYCIDAKKDKAKKELYEFNQEDLEKYSQEIFKHIESDIHRFCDMQVVDRKPFYLFKDKLVSLIVATRTYYTKLS
jgi:hypothetical protein